MCNRILLSTFLLFAAVCGQSPVDAKCPANSTFKSCSSMCEPKCGVMIKMMCIERCGDPKCECNPGYLRDTNGACVLEKDCSTNQGNCSLNERWDGCGNACEAKCGDTELRVCPMICRLEGACACQSGFYRDVNGKCVTKDECQNQVPKCTAKCPAGQICVLKPVICVRAPCNPVPTCVDANEPTGCAAVSCLAGEECVVDANGNGKCVAGGTNGNCSANEYFNECTGCEAMCGQTSPVACPKICITPGRCRCKEGFFRDRISGKCMTQNECDSRIEPILSCASVLCIINTTCIETPSGPRCVPINNGNCSRNEFWDGCGGCEAKCGDEEPVMCTEMCRPGKCRCKDGFFRNTNNQCVTKKECSPRITCANVRCAGPCIDTPRGPQCIGTDQACNLDCTIGFECVLAQPPLCGSNCIKTPTCIPKNITSCKMMKCNRDTHCAMVQVQCFAPPCYPVPQCVPNENQPVSTCAVVDCMPGYHCIEETVNCVMAPCPQQGTHARCVPTQPEFTCANVDCMSGMICQMAEVNCTNDLCLPTPQCFSPDTTTICEKNEIYTDCVPNCEDTCHGIPSCKGEMMAAVCQTGCKCAAGYRRNASGKCVRKNCYKNPGCGENEEWGKCFGCEKKCGQATDESCSESCRSGCGCVDGFARHSTNGTCVPQSEC